ncbi:MAG: 3-deoxy-manno-octulosonate cytidylyltransferase [Heyndrickxia sp.]
MPLYSYRCKKVTFCLSVQYIAQKIRNKVMDRYDHLIKNGGIKMKIIGVIPARYKSTRFEGKPLADICGRPMVWWVYNQLNKVRGIEKTYVATDDERIKNVCEYYGMNVVMTADNHPTHLDRLYEFSTIIDADFYININGDEPLIESKYIEKLLPKNVDPSESYAANAMTTIKNPVEVVDFARIKIVTDMDSHALYMARSPLPYPKAAYDFEYKKFVGIQCFTKKALQFCHDHERGFLESIEDIDEFRFLEHGHRIKFIQSDAVTLSVDTPKDLEKVRTIIEQKLSSRELVI